MGKKKLRKNVVSKGQRPNTSSTVLKMVRRGTDAIDKHLKIVKAWRQGKNPWVAVHNTNRQETAKKIVRVHANDLWGNPKFLSPNLFRD